MNLIFILFNFFFFMLKFGENQHLNIYNRRPNECISPTGQLGECRSVYSCFWVKWNIQKQRQFACFRGILFFGICCPKNNSLTNKNFLDKNNLIKTINLPKITLNETVSELQVNSLKTNLSNSFNYTLNNLKNVLNEKENLKSPVITISISAYSPITNKTSNKSNQTKLNSNVIIENEIINTNKLNENLLNNTIDAIKKDYFTKQPFLINLNESFQEYPDTVYMNIIKDENNQTIQQYQQTNLNECGISGRNYRIVGGTSAHDGQWPWMAAIYLDRSNKNKKKEFWCGGTLINRNFILTAAHCVTDPKGTKYFAKQITITLGSNWIERNYSNFNNLPSEAKKYLKKFKAQDVHIHENFQRNGFNNDIALIKLNKIVDLNERIRCICLPSRNDVNTDLTGYLAKVVGWGSTHYGGIGSNRLQQVAFPIWNTSDCDQRFPQKINSKFLCAGYLLGGKDACQGDSGSPLMLPDQNQQWRIQGIVSFGNKCAQPGYPGVYTRVAEYLDWIHQKTES